MIEYREEKDGFGSTDKIWYPEMIKDLKVFTFKELHKPEVEAVIEKARKMYRDDCAKYLKKHKDGGSCVLGNGIYIAVKPLRARTVFKLELCTPMGQGEGAGYKCKDKVMNFLQQNGINCWYECGRMD